MRAIAPEARTSGVITLSGGTVDTANPDDAKNYLDRVRAYIPIEVVAFFVFANSLVLGTELKTSKIVEKVTVTYLTTDGWSALAALVIGALATLLTAFLASRAKGRQVWLTHAAVSLLAFGAWSYAIGARAYEILNIAIVPSMAGILLAAFTLFSGLIVPVELQPQPEPQPQPQPEPQPDPAPAPDPSPVI